MGEENGKIEKTAAMEDYCMRHETEDDFLCSESLFDVCSNLSLKFN